MTLALSDKKVLLVVPERDFDEQQYERVLRVLESRGIKVTTGSSYVGEIRGMKGSSARASVELGNVKTYDYDAFVFIGGPGVRKLGEDQKVVKLAKDAEYKVLGALGTASLILAQAEVLKGKKATADRSVAEFIESKGGRFTGQPIQVEGKIVTAEGPKYAEQFANALMEALQR